MKHSAWFELGGGHSDLLGRVSHVISETNVTEGSKIVADMFTIDFKLFKQGIT